MFLEQLKSIKILFLVLTLFKAPYSRAAIKMEVDDTTGIQVGFMPYCPGVEKNATLTSSLLSKYKIVYNSKDILHYNKEMRILEAPSYINKHNLLDFKKKTVIIVAAMHDTAYFPHYQLIATQYNKKGFNVLIVDTFHVFYSFTYPEAARLSKDVGKRLGQFLVELTRQGLRPEDVEMVGFSVGAHTMGLAGQYYYKIIGMKIPRLTGLDPAGPCFRNLPPELILDASDGEKVDVVHTNIDGLGIASRCGHIDIYVNGGEYQPADLSHYFPESISSHYKSIIYWWESLMHPKKFIAIQCDTIQDARSANCYDSNNTNYLGHNTDFSKPGIYYLSTTNMLPYYRGKEGVIKGNDFVQKYTEHNNEKDKFVAKNIFIDLDF